MATDPTLKLTPMEQAMTWERMSGERLSDAERERIMQGGEFHPPSANEPVDTQTRESLVLMHLTEAVSDAIIERIAAHDPGSLDEIIADEVGKMLIRLAEDGAIDLSSVNVSDGDNDADL